MAGRKQRGRGGGRGYRGGRGFGRGGDRGGGDGGGRGRGRGRGLGYVAMHEIDDDFVVEPVPFRTSGPPSLRISFIVGALQTPGITRGAARRLLTQEDTNAREGSALIMSRTTRTAWTTATTSIARGTRLPCREPVPALARLAGTDISVGAVGGGLPAQTLTCWSPKTACGSAILSRNYAMGMRPCRNCSMKTARSSSPSRSCDPN